LRSLAAEIVLPLASPGHGGAATPRAANSPPVSPLRLSRIGPAALFFTANEWTWALDGGPAAP
jgi:hypothetical protein